MSSTQQASSSDNEIKSETSEKVQQQSSETKRDSVTKKFLNTLGTVREISKPIKAEVEDKEPKPKTADDFEIPYHREKDKNHPFEKWRRNRYYRCLITREIARYLDRKTFITVSVREGLIFCVFLILLSIITLGGFSLEKFYLHKEMIRWYTFNEFKVEDFFDELKLQDSLKITFLDINTLEEVWFYQHYLVSKLLFAQFWDQGKEALFENIVLGPLQIRQIRVKNHSCQTYQDIMNVNKTCYGLYTEGDEETDNIGLPSLILTDTLEKSTVWRPPNETGSLPFSGMLATYGGGGYVAHLRKGGDPWQFTTSLMNMKWYTRATRAIFLEFTIYNGNVNLFCIFKLIFEIPLSGGVIPSYRIYTKKLIRYDNSYDTFILVCEIISFTIVLFYTLQKILEIITLRMKLLKSFWIYIDIMILITSYMTFTYNILLYISMEEKYPELLTWQSKPDYISLDKPLHLQILYSRFFALLIGFSFVRLLKYFTIFHSMYQLQVTISRAVPDILGYFTIFLYLYIMFALVGVFLFRNKLQDFLTLPMALYSLMKYSIADFNFDRLVQAEPILGPMFFMIFIFFIVFIISGLFLAILISKYQEVRSEVSIGGAKTFIKDMLLLWFLQLLRRMECPWLLSQIEREEFEEKAKSPMEHVRYYLRQAGYSELEIELFFKKYDITDLKIEAMEEMRTSYVKGEREAPPPLSQKDIMRYIVIQKLDYLEKHYQQASRLIDEFLKKLSKVERKSM